MPTRDKRELDELLFDFLDTLERIADAMEEIAQALQNGHQPKKPE